MTNYIVEHPTKGCLREIDFGYVPSDKPKARFSWSGARNDPDKALQFATQESAFEALNMVNVIDPKLGAQCQVRKGPDYGVVERESAEPPDLEVVVTFLVYVKADPDKPEDVMNAAHSRETQLELRRLAAMDDYYVTWEGHEG